MKSITCDILIIGAGPAGSSAAISAAKKGMDVLVVEQRPKIGLPVQCAEYIPAPLVGQLNMGTDFVVQKVLKMKTVLPDGFTAEMAAPGFMIHRDRFDQALAEKASKLGARILLSAKAVKRTKEGRVIVRKDRKNTLTVLPRVIIGADGPRSKTAAWCGISVRNLLPAVQYRMNLPTPMNHTEVHLSADFYGGYAWLFPKGETANVGIGMKRVENSTGKIKTLLDRFTEKLAIEGKIVGKPLSATGGWIPAAPLKSAVFGNVLLAGDAAGHTHPITGAGIFAAVSCGRMAGSWASKAIRKDNFALLREYDREWRDLFGESLERAFEKRRFMEREWERFSEIIRSCWIGFREYYETGN